MDEMDSVDERVERALRNTEALAPGAEERIWKAIEPDLGRIGGAGATARARRPPIRTIRADHASAQRRQPALLLAAAAAVVVALAAAGVVSLLAPGSGHRQSGAPTGDSTAAGPAANPVERGYAERIAAYHSDIARLEAILPPLEDEPLREALRALDAALVDVRMSIADSSRVRAAPDLLRTLELKRAVLERIRARS